MASAPSPRRPRTHPPLLPGQQCRYLVRALTPPDPPAREVHTTATATAIDASSPSSTSHRGRGRSALLHRLRRPAHCGRPRLPRNARRFGGPAAAAGDAGTDYTPPQLYLDCASGMVLRVCPAWVAGGISGAREIGTGGANAW
ncbi:hypothetical protein HYPSUDRAFT_40632 [Hypholoma sublateritium FD-334 SS-4]|uniref:Uncharacterized protein n=1 Tax=Hypholoma sublateritium (strain FD-334 SS-4) TaxID=945553 RepID=A0A0D2L713_HYPSF|nr:hypothetical protein HYPSUDRAFT_40632 [Hypholoma sublateritium FD-334 SS-4]